MTLTEVLGIGLNPLRTTRVLQFKFKCLALPKAQGVAILMTFSSVKSLLLTSAWSLTSLFLLHPGRGQLPPPLCDLRMHTSDQGTGDNAACFRSNIVVKQSTKNYG